MIKTTNRLYLRSIDHFMQDNFLFALIEISGSEPMRNSEYKVVHDIDSNEVAYIDITTGQLQQLEVGQGYTMCEYCQKSSDDLIYVESVSCRSGPFFMEVIIEEIVEARPNNVALCQHCAELIESTYALSMDDNYTDVISKVI